MANRLYIKHYDPETRGHFTYSYILHTQGVLPIMGRGLVTEYGARVGLVITNMSYKMVRWVVKHMMDVYGLYELGRIGYTGYK